MAKPEADHGVPEAEHRPGRAEQEADEEDCIDDRPAAGAEHPGCGGRERKIRNEVNGSTIVRRPRNSLMRCVPVGVVLEPTGSKGGVRRAGSVMQVLFSGKAG